VHQENGLPHHGALLVPSPSPLHEAAGAHSRQLRRLLSPAGSTCASNSPGLTARLDGWCILHAVWCAGRARLAARPSLPPVRPSGHGRSQSDAVPTALVCYIQKLRDVRAVRCVQPARRSGRLALTEWWFDRRRPRSSSHPSWFVEYHRVRAEPHMRSHSADSHTCQAHTLAQARAHTGQATLRAHTGELAAADVQPHVGPVEWLLRQVLSIIPLRGGPRDQVLRHILHPDHCYRRRRCLGGAFSYAMTSSSSAAAAYMLMLSLTLMLTTMLMTMLPCLLNE
jgi:hypothetical protein